MARDGSAEQRGSGSSAASVRARGTAPDGPPGEGTVPLRGVRALLARDGLLCVLVAAASCALLASVDYMAAAAGTPFAPAGVGAIALLLVLQSAALYGRRRAPLLCLAAVAAGQGGIIVLIPADATLFGLACFVAGYTAGGSLPLRKLWPYLAAITAGLALCGAVSALPPLAGLAPAAEYLGGPWTGAATAAVSAALAFGLPGLIGSDLAARRRLALLEERRAADAQRERVRGAIRGERTRMARELHDIAAHHLSGMVVQTGAAEQLIGRDDQAARQMVAWVRAQGRETLVNLRMMVGTLREPGSPHDTAGGDGDTGAGTSGTPVPGVDALDALVERERESGAAVGFERGGPPRAPPPVADSAFYRVAQEALANARDHAAGAPVRIGLDYQPSATMLQIENGPGSERADSGRELRGLGLIGMRERADLIGAALECGPTDSGGWRVRITLPCARNLSADGADRATAEDAPHDQGRPGG